MNTAWFVWERNDDGSYGDGHPRLIRVVYDHYEHVAALRPGAGVHVSPITFANADRDEEFTRTTPRKSVDERVDEEIHRAILWLKEMEPFDSAGLRRGIGVRDSVAVAIIEAMSGLDLIKCSEDGLWMPTGAGIRLTTDANAHEMVQAWRAGKAVAA